MASVPTRFDPRLGAFVFATGKKGSGKSVLCRTYFDDYPFSKLVIDPTGDVTRNLLQDGVEVTVLTPDALPLRFPKHLDDERRPVTAVFVPDMGLPTAVDDMDRALGLALANQRTCCWIDEIGVMTHASSTPPNLRRALHHGRHDRLTLIMAGPRPVAIDPLVLAQSDYVATFALPNPRDRQRVAETIGWPPKSFSDAVHNLGKHQYLWYVAEQGELYQMPPIPVTRRLATTAAVGVAG